MPNAYILTKVTPNKEYEVLDAFKKLDYLESADLVYGKYDLIVKVKADTDENLKNVVLEKVRQLPNIEGTCTLLVAGSEE